MKYSSQLSNQSLESVGNTTLSFFVTMGDTMTELKLCNVCGTEEVIPARYLIGYRTCLKCGEVMAGKRKFTVVPMHKSNYVVISNKKELKGINNKEVCMSNIWWWILWGALASAIVSYVDIIFGLGWFGI